jgi:hypothetical protein
MQISQSARVSIFYHPPPNPLAAQVRLHAIMQPPSGGQVWVDVLKGDMGCVIFCIELRGSVHVYTKLAMIAVVVNTKIAWNCRACAMACMLHTRRMAAKLAGVQLTCNLPVLDRAKECSMVGGQDGWVHKIHSKLRKPVR